ncbi:metalloregulator ArsR/SmtB family transcription factor [Amycolatopsis sp. NPDC026612]|uniref:ArsR/SmtB family transcription factor n=1 Tax=Amycolatopsis sp. NPDC026612 TaxID=3155466 RepID=UPI0033D9E927
MENTEARWAGMLRALGHPVRLGIMRRLAAEPETCACDFSDVFTLKQPTVSQHLKVLREAGLVTTRRRGTQICYSVQPGAIVEITDMLGALTAHPEPGPTHLPETARSSA